MSDGEVVEDNGSGEVAHMMGLGDGENVIASKRYPTNHRVFNLQNMIKIMCRNREKCVAV